MENSLLDQNHKYCEETKELKDSLEGAFLELGERLMKIRNGRLYHPQHDSFESYVEDIKMSLPNASKLITVYEKFVLQFGFSQREITDFGGWSRVYEVHRLTATRAEAEAFLFDRKHLSLGDLRKEVYEKNTGILESECDHKNGYTMFICRSCGHKHVVFDEKEEI